MTNNKINNLLNSILTFTLLFLSSLTGTYFSSTKKIQIIAANTKTTN